MQERKCSTCHYSERELAALEGELARLHDEAAKTLNFDRLSAIFRRKQQVYANRDAVLRLQMAHAVYAHTALPRDEQEGYGGE